MNTNDVFQVIYGSLGNFGYGDLVFKNGKIITELGDNGHHAYIEEKKLKENDLSSDGGCIIDKTVSFSIKYGCGCSYEILSNLFGFKDFFKKFDDCLAIGTPKDKAITLFVQKIKSYNKYTMKDIQNIFVEIDEKIQKNMTKQFNFANSNLY